MFFEDGREAVYGKKCFGQASGLLLTETRSDFPHLWMCPKAPNQSVTSHSVFTKEHPDLCQNLSELEGE